MAEPVTINLRHIARGLGIPVRQVQAAVELLDEGNTVPFITRYRKDQTGGLNEEQIRQIQARLSKARLLAERKQTILRSIESQGKLTPELEKRIRAAGSAKRIEDLYLPYKPKKQTLATAARSHGLEPLAREIVDAAPSCADLDARAADFVNPDRQVPTVADALLGAGHIIAEQFSERADLRQRLREILQRTGRIFSTPAATETTDGQGPKTPRSPQTAESRGPAPDRAAPPEPAGAPQTDKPLPPNGGPSLEAVAGPESQPEAERLTQADRSPGTPSNQDAAAGNGPPVGVGQAGGDQTGEDQPDQDDRRERAADGAPPPEETSGQGAGGSPPEHLIQGQQTTPQRPDGPDGLGSVSGASQPSPGLDVPEPPAGSAPVAEGEGAVCRAASPGPPAAAEVTAPAPSRATAQTKSDKKARKKEQKRKKAEEKKQKAFRDYFDYSEEIRKIPPHRVLALNRGERLKVLRVRIECDMEAVHRVVDEMCVPAEHPHADFLRGCARDATTRLILPALEREARRELTERAENHAVSVFARNLRALLLQPPVRNHRVLAIDPGLQNGCKLVALDQFGNVLDHGIIYLVGKKRRRGAAEQLILRMVDQWKITVIAVGNGTGCRETESFIGELVSTRLRDQDVCYVIINEAGASVYSTSRIGREEFPEYDATLRGAISIGRRLQDPLSELVKIDPASIGVGLYQHDVKAKHLRASLDEVVESCVNYVGVDVNTASPALLRYVSGLNQLTARRLYEYRLDHGPFRNRQQLREVPGIGNATFVQAAGFLKITSGDNPFDATWIHPESYPVAAQLLEKLGHTPEELRDRQTVNRLAQQIRSLDANALAEQLAVGTHLVRDILAQFARPGRDPREDLPPPVFKQDVLKLEDLTVGMELSGTVLNVVDFGAFVDIGMHDSGLVHVSQLADKFVRDPHDVVAVGDIVKVWVMDVDKSRRRVSLTMIPPEARKRGPRRDRPESPPPRPKRAAAPAHRRAVPDKKAKAPPPKPKRSARREGRPKPPPRPAAPITEDMKTGKAPMRSFSDLAQFFFAKQEEARQQAQTAHAGQPQPGTKKPGRAKKTKRPDRPAAPEQPPTPAETGQPEQAPRSEETPPQQTPPGAGASQEQIAPPVADRAEQQTREARQNEPTDGPPQAETGDYDPETGPSQTNPP